MDYSPACYLRTKKTSSETSKRHTNVIKSDELRCMVGGHLFFLNQKCAAPYVACEFDRTGAEKYHPGQTHRRHFSQFEERNGTRNGFSLLAVERVRRLFPKRNGENCYQSDGRLEVEYRTIAHVPIILLFQCERH